MEGEWLHELSGLLLDEKISQADFDRVVLLPRTVSEWVSDCSLFLAEDSLPLNRLDGKPPFTDVRDIFALYGSAFGEDLVMSTFGDCEAVVEASEDYRWATTSELLLFARDKFRWNQFLVPFTLQGGLCWSIGLRSDGYKMLRGVEYARSHGAGSCSTLITREANTRLLVVRKR